MNDLLKSKIKNSFNNQALIWNALFNDDEFEEMLSYSRQAIKYSLNSYSQSFSGIEKRVIFITLVEIARRKNSSMVDESNDRGFWDYVFVHLEIKYANSIYIILTESINSLSIVKATNKKKYYGTVLMHALAPQKSLFSFFDLCYNIYKNDLDFNFTQEDKSFIEYCAIRFAEIIDQGRIGEGEDISIGSNAYSIKIGLRQMSINMKDQFTNIIEKTIYLINQLFHNILQHTEQSGYLDEKVKEWWQNKFNSVNIDQKSFKYISRAISQESISVSYILENNEVYIFIPSIRLKEDGEVLLIIRDSNEQKTIIPVRTRKNEFTTTTVQHKLKLNDLTKDCILININVRIEINRNTIYNSESKLNRHFILFDGESEISKSINTSNNYFLYTRDNDLLETVKKKNIVKAQMSTYLYNIYPQNGDTINGKFRNLVFIDYRKNKVSQNIELIGNITNTEWIINDRHFQIFNNSPKLLVNNLVALNGLELRIDSKKILLADIAEKTLDEESNYYIFDLKLYICNEQPCHLSVYSYVNEKDLLVLDLVQFKDLKVHFNEPMYFSEGKKFVECIYNGNVIRSDFGFDKEELIVDFNSVFFVISIPWLKWRIDNGKWSNHSGKKTMWYKNVLPTNGSILEFEIPSPYSINDLKLYYSRNDLKNAIGPCELEANNGKFNLGRLIYSIGEYENIELSVCFIDNSFYFINISTKEHFACLPVSYSTDYLHWCPQESYIGNKECKFSLELINDSTKHSLNNLTLTDEIVDIKNIKKDVYKLSIVLHNPSSLLEHGKEIYKCDFIVGIKEQLRFKGKEMIIQEVYCGYEKSESNMVFEQLKPEYFIDNLEYILIDGDDYYLGNLGVISKEGKRIYLNSMKNSDDVYEKINPVGVRIITNTIIEIIAGFDVNSPDDSLGYLFFDKSTKFINNVENKKSPNCINGCKFISRRK